VKPILILRDLVQGALLIQRAERHGVPAGATWRSASEL
jgi:hypothetical protein